MSRYNPVVGVSEATALLFLFLTSKVFLSYSPFLYDSGFNAAWIFPLLQLPFVLLGVFLYCNLLEKFPGRDLVEIGEKLLGPYINTLFALSYLVFFIVAAGLSLRGISERVVAGFLPDTPISLVAIAFMSGAFVVGYLGIEAVARTARFFVGIIVIFSLILIIMTIPFWKMDAIYPIWGSGLLKIAQGSLLHLGDFVNILLLGIIFPFIPQNTASKIGVRSVILAGVFMFLFVLVPILIFSFPTVAEINHPSFLMSRIISLGRFGQRMEVVFLPVWVFANLLAVSISLYAGGAIMSRMFRLSDYRPFILSTTVLVFVMAFIPQNIAQVFEWGNRYITQYAFVPFAAILVVLLFVARVKEKGGSKNEKGF